MSPIEAAMACASRAGLSAVDPTVIHDGSNTLIRLDPLPVVARVATRTGAVRHFIEQYQQRELDIAWSLADHGWPVIPPADVDDPGPHRVRGYSVSLWQYVALEPVDDADAQDVGVRLAELHRHLRTVRDEIPSLVEGPGLPFVELGTVFGVIANHANAPSVGVTPHDLEFMSLRSDQLFELLAPTITGDPTHGDAGRGNVGRRADGEIVWFDFEDTNRSTALWDVVTLQRSWPEAAAAFVQALGEPVDDLARVHMLEFRQLYMTAWVVYAALELERVRPRAADMLRDARARWG
jgi:hypothetical protein